MRKIVLQLYLRIVNICKLTNILNHRINTQLSNCSYYTVIYVTYKLFQTCIMLYFIIIN